MRQEQGTAGVGPPQISVVDGVSRSGRDLERRKASRFTLPTSTPSSTASAAPSSLLFLLPSDVLEPRA